MTSRPTMRVRCLTPLHQLNAVRRSGGLQLLSLSEWEKSFEECFISMIDQTPRASVTDSFGHSPETRAAIASLCGRASATPAPNASSDTKSSTD